MTCESSLSELYDKFDFDFKGHVTKPLKSAHGPI